MVISTNISRMIHASFKGVLHIFQTCFKCFSGAFFSVSTRFKEDDVLESYLKLSKIIRNLLFET